MTTLTIDRAVVEQALEALEASSGCLAFKNIMCRCSEPCRSYTAAQHLSAALAQQAEPDWQDLYVKEKQRADMWRDKYESVAGAEQRIYLQAEPVAGNTLLKAFLAAAKEAGVTHIRQAEADLRAALAQQAEQDQAGCETEKDCTSQPWCRISGECHRKQAEPVDTDCHTQGICQRSGYGIGRQSDPQIEDRRINPCPDCRGIGYDASGQLCWCQQNPSF